MRNAVVFVCLAWFTSAVSVAAAEEQVSPTRGQTQEQQQRDQFECHEWATKETGVDPVALAEQQFGTPTPSSEHHGGAGRGAAVGAMRGAAEGDAASGAMRGVGIGRLIAVARSRRQLKEQQSAGGAQAAPDVKGQLARYDAAYATCLSARGYTVK
ncbi:MAG: glycine zipper family protein [Candidatus Binatia bacterium]